MKTGRWIGLLGGLGIVVLLVGAFASMLFVSRAAINFGDTQYRALLNDAALVVTWSAEPKWKVDAGITSEMRDHWPDFTVVPSFRSQLAGAPIRELVLPLWIPAAVCLIPLVINHVRRIRRSPERCHKCGYSWKGLNPSSNKCPECGTARASGVKE